MPTKPLDELFCQLDAAEPAFLKIDTQGAETAVLRGAKETLKTVVGVKLELSLIKLYDGQDLAHALDSQLRDAGFECWDVVPGFRNRATGQLLQYDGIYFKTS